jgi:formamidopyrimidine-DNA glycosylase
MLCWFELEGEGVITVGFGMSGAFREALEKHCHVEWRYRARGGREERSLWFCDPRLFGNVRWVAAGIEGVLGELGLDLMGRGVEDERRVEAVALMRRVGRKRNICVALMDQAAWSGVGNYIKSEAMYRASVSPWSTVDGLSDEQLGQLWHEARAVAWCAYGARGASLYTYRGTRGEEGEFQKVLMVYGKKVDPWGRRVRSVETPDGRTTWYVDERDV